jgi:hypothetical protein
MSAVGGTYQDGRIVLDRAVDWPEGTRVCVQLLPADHSVDGVWPHDGSPEGNAAILRRLEEGAADGPTPEEAAAFDKAMEHVREFEKAAARKLLGLDK